MASISQEVQKLQTQVRDAETDSLKVKKRLEQSTEERKKLFAKVMN
jgi:hypothetical protein